jgi:chemotaxis protein CheX
MIEDLENLVRTAVNELFTTMLRLPVQPVELSTAAANGEPHVASAVGFVGRVTGVMYVHTSISFARSITANFLQLSEAEVDADEMVNDAMGEVANMLMGQMKSSLSDRGIACALTVPSVVRGSHFRIEPISSVRGAMFAFKTGSAVFFIEVLLKCGEANPID